MPTPFEVELVTPEKVLFKGSCEEVSLRTEEGEAAFLAHHEDFIGALDITVVSLQGPESDRAENQSNEVRVAVHGGFVHVNDAGVTILARLAELASDIDVDRARRALQSASERLASAGPTDFEALGQPAGLRPSNALLGVLLPDAPEAAQARARVRLEAAGASTAT